MRKSNMLIAIFAVIIAAVSFVKAAEFGVDFDRGALRGTDFMEAIRTSYIAKADNSGSIMPVPATAPATVNTKVHQLTDSELQRLRKETSSMPGLSKEFLKQIKEKDTVLLYNDKNVLLTTLVGNVHYITLESADRILIEFLAKQQMKGLQDGSTNKQWVRVCFTKTETIMKWVNNAWVAYEIAKEICGKEWKDDPTPDNNPGMGGPLNWPVRLQSVH